ncbi:MAG: hypothetical protein CM1200mP41_32860 [Gammaproteobacteria bacterium]|nr:MAG: hypothetical protein CM1200mP41_32860 [Gammaproteobacteria bacterium]
MLGCARVGAVHSVFLGDFPLILFAIVFGLRLPCVCDSGWGAARWTECALKPNVETRWMGVQMCIRLLSFAGPAIVCPVMHRGVWYQEAMEAMDTQCPAEEMVRRIHCSFCIPRVKPGENPRG